MTNFIKQLKQEIFNDVWAGAKAQGFVQVVDAADGACAYRGGKNNCLKCNAGHLIPDEAYTADIEGTSIDDKSVWSITKYGDRIKALNDEDQWNVIEFLGMCQNAHDSGDEPALHKHLLVSLATDEGLETVDAGVTQVY